MIKVTLLGDSIRTWGYGIKAPEILKDEFEFFQPEENCRFAKHTLRGIFEWEKDIAGSRIIHWNNGIWDVADVFGDGLFSSEEEYVSNMMRICNILLQRCDKLIFATTTPVREENPHIKTKDIERYNNLIVPLLKEKGVIINDLFDVVIKDIEKYIRADDCLHPTEEGFDVITEQVVKVLRETAKTLDSETSVKPRKIYDDIEKSGAPI